MLPDVMDENNSTWAHLNPSWIDHLSKNECIDTSAMSEAFIDLPDATYYSLSYGVTNITGAELQKYLSTKGKPTLSPAEISELREDGVVV